MRLALILYYIIHIKDLNLFYTGETGSEIIYSMKVMVFGVMLCAHNTFNQKEWKGLAFLYKIYPIPLKPYISIEYRFRQALRLYDLKSYTVNILDIII